MPITYKYDNEANIIRTTASGKVKTGDLRDYVTKVLEDTRIKKGFIEIADFESVTDLVVAYSEINQFPAPSNLSYGIFRMLQTVISLRHKSANDLFIVIRTKEEIENKLQDLIS
jgi:hypothetical protein